MLECSLKGLMTQERASDEAAWKAFGEWVEDLRVRTGLQVGEVAERAGVSRVWLQEIRNGSPEAGASRTPRPTLLVRLARALNVPPETMLARAGRGAPSTAEAGAQVDDAGAAERIRVNSRRGATGTRACRTAATPRTSGEARRR